MMSNNKMYRNCEQFAPTAVANDGGCLDRVSKPSRAPDAAVNTTMTHEDAVDTRHSSAAAVANDEGHNVSPSSPAAAANINNDKEMSSKQLGASPSSSHSVRPPLHQKKADSAAIDPSHLDGEHHHAMPHYGSSSSRAANCMGGERCCSPQEERTPQHKALDKLLGTLVMSCAVAVVGVNMLMDFAILLMDTIATACLAVLSIVGAAIVATASYTKDLKGKSTLLLRVSTLVVALTVAVALCSCVALTPLWQLGSLSFEAYQRSPDTAGQLTPPTNTVGGWVWPHIVSDTRGLRDNPIEDAMCDVTPPDRIAASVTTNDNVSLDTDHLVITRGTGNRADLSTWPIETRDGGSSSDIPKNQIQPTTMCVLFSSATSKILNRFRSVEVICA